jgi:nicotinate-nucleotide adenylyltransferase
MRIGIFGGSFDPVHVGHLLLAECCREQAQLDAVWFLPAAVSPLKTGNQSAPAEDRAEMLRLAIAGHEAFSVNTLEIDRGGVSFTADTLRQLAEADSSRELFFPMGADSLVDLPRWREPQVICTLATPLVVRRAGSPEPDFDALASIIPPDRIEQIRAAQIEMPTVELSSTNIRRRVAGGQSIRFQTPRAVEKYIETQGLYGTESQNGDESS